MRFSNRYAFSNPGTSSILKFCLCPAASAPSDIALCIAGKHTVSGRKIAGAEQFLVLNCWILKVFYYLCNSFKVLTAYFLLNIPGRRGEIVETFLFIYPLQSAVLQYRVDYICNIATMHRTNIVHLKNLSAFLYAAGQLYGDTNVLAVPILHFSQHSKYIVCTFEYKYRVGEMSRHICQFCNLHIVLLY